MRGYLVPTIKSTSSGAHCLVVRPDAEEIMELLDFACTTYGVSPIHRRRRRIRRR
jgi:hypothetical protein